jgi:hypothetical protein
MSRVNIKTSAGTMLAEVPDQYADAVREDPERFRWLWAEQYAAFARRVSHAL